jgi:hypothetical protein
MAEPRGIMAIAAVGRDHLRASDADREHVIGALKTAFTVGITAGPCGSKPSRPLTRAEHAAAWGVCGLIVSAVLTVIVIPAGTTKGVVVGTAAAIYAVSWLLAAIMMVAARHRGSRPARRTT